MGLIVQIGADLSKFEREMNKATKDISYLGDKMGKAGSALTMGVTAPIVGVGIAAGKMAVDFDTSFAKVSTLFDSSKGDADEFKKSIMNASKDSGVALGEYTDALYQAMSAGQDQGEAVEFTTKAMELARGGFTSATSAVDILTTAINGYGKEAYSADQIADMLITTQNKGKTTVDELSQSMGKVIPIAKSVNFGMEELSAGYAQLTYNGIATAEAGTYMKSMLAELGKSGSLTDKALRELSGKGFAQLKEEGVPTADILNMLSGYAEKNGKTLKDMFGSVEAGTAALIMASGEGEQYNQFLNDMTQSAGAANTANEIMSDTAQVKMQTAFNELKVTLTELGAVLIPVITSIAEKLSEVVNWFVSLSPEAQATIGVLLGVAAAIGPILLGISKAIEIYKAFKLVSAAVKAANIATTISMFGLTVPIWAVVAVIAAVIAIGYLLVKNWDTICEAATNFGNWVSTKFKECAEWISQSWNDLMAFLSQWWEEFSAKAKETWDNFVAGWNAFWETVGRIILAGLMSIISFFTSTFVSIIQYVVGAWDNICEKTRAFLTNLGNVISAGIKSVITFWKAQLDMFVLIFKEGFNAIVNIGKNVLGVIVGIITGDFTKAKDSLFGILDSIGNYFKNIWNGCANIVKVAIDKIKGFFNFEWSLPKLKMPHFKVSGKFSLNPISVPSFGIDWYSKGGIFTKPTVMGGVGVGDAINGRGNGPEAVLPIKKLPELLGLDKNGDTPQTITTVVNLDGREIARATSNYMDTELRRNRDKKSRANGGM